jgi:hypothetical protein
MESKTSCIVLCTWTQALVPMLYVVFCSEPVFYAGILQSLDQVEDDWTVEIKIVFMEIKSADNGTMAEGHLQYRASTGLDPQGSEKESNKLG